MGTHSGKFGVVNGYSTVRNWTIVDTMTLSEAVASNTRAGKARRPAIHDWNGSFGGYGGRPPVMPGEIFSFDGYTAPDTEIDGDPGVVYNGQAIVESVQVVWNWEAGEIINWVANIAGDGQLANDVGAYSDLSLPDLPPVCGRTFEFQDGSTGDGSGAYTEWTNLQQATLQISSANLTYVNSSTIFGTECWMRRLPGIIDWNLSVQEQDNIRTRFQKGDDLFLKLYTTVSEFWYLAFGKIREFTGLNVDRESGAILAQTVNIDMNGFRASDGMAGWIVEPNGTEFWPTNATTTAAA